MLSIEEIKLLIEKLEKVKKEDLQELIDSNLKILKDIEFAVDANNTQLINRLSRTPEWFERDLQQKRDNPYVWQKTDEPLRRIIQTKIFQSSRSNLYNSLEIGPGDGMFSMDFRADQTGSLKRGRVLSFRLFGQFGIMFSHLFWPQMVVRTD